MSDKLTWAEAPLTCPACGAESDKATDGYVFYDCGASLVTYDGPWELNWRCTAAFEAAVRLRAELADMTLQRDAAWTEIKRLRASLKPTVS